MIEAKSEQSWWGLSIHDSETPKRYLQRLPPPRYDLARPHLRTSGRNWISPNFPASRSSTTQRDETEPENCPSLLLSQTTLLLLDSCLGSPPRAWPFLGSTSCPD